MGTSKIILQEQVRGYYIGTKAAVEALTGVAEGSIGYATDSNEFGSYNGAAWTWGQGGPGVTNGDSHDHAGGDGAQINHTGLSNIGTNTHAAIDTHIANTSNPHSVTAAQVGAVAHSLATAADDFLVASGAGAWVKKTLAQTITILRTSLDSIFAPIAKGVTGGDSHGHAWGAITGDLADQADLISEFEAINLVLDAHTDNIFNPHLTDAAQVDAIPESGWEARAEAWTRTGNHTFTAPGDLTAIFRKGAKVRYKDGGSFEYGAVASSSHAAGTTTINLIPNTDYTMAAATITDRYISYIENPEGFPHWFNFNASPSGFSIVPSSPVYRWQATGSTLKILYSEPNNGTSNATTFSATAPVASVQNVTAVAGTLVNNGALLTTAGRLTMTSGSAAITFRSDMSVGAWTNVNGKRAVASFFYEF